ncbi:MAG: hypothetical protein KBF37_10395 [Saprospiraceae bacterium]|jgi:quaternary ammonium compound-resistance protein SugE|nr:hypothetical protein [Saprospiraceae bacterium]MBP9210716.1 hypothetical protein [Saprospiraceae bacterium]
MTTPDDKYLAWIYLLAAAVMEILWMLSVKFLKVQELRNIVWGQFFSRPEGIRSLMPLLGYLGFGLLNVIFIAQAMKSIPMSVAFGVWMALALFGSACLDAFLFRQPLNAIQIGSMGLIMLGVLGLKAAG